MKKIISVILTFAMMLSMITIVQAADFGGNGYNFVCVDGGRYLNVYAGKDADGTNVCVWERDGSPEQNYTISSVGGGKYKLYPACSSSRVIDVNRGNSYNNPLKAGLNVDLWRTNDAPAQEFYITHVGNNLYKIELAALSGHVLQANSPNKNNGNVTLERYTGASNQHWKILKNGTQVTEPCTHKNISNKNEKTTVAKKDDNTHTVTTAYDEVCNDCGKTVKSNQKKTDTEKHSISNNKCSKCGYEVTVVEEKPVESTPIEEPTVCKHEKTYTIENSVTYGSTDRDIKVKDDEYHIGYYYADEYCSKCKVLVNKKIIVEQESLHTYLNGVCTSCLHHHHTEKPEETELRINKTTFTPGEKIELNWPIANRASSYDIHIYKEGMGSRYRLDSGFTDNSANIVINDEGVFDLSIYSINNQGYTRGNNIKITVKSPYEEKTAYVYNTDGDNLNMRSQANSSSSVVVKIPAGATLTVTGDAVNGFYPIKYNGKTGYASTAYITFTKPSVNKTAYVYNTDGANLNMRSSANKNASIVTKMPEGSTLTVTGDATNGFYPVKYGNHSGYASAAYITFTKPANTNANQSLSNIRISAPEKNNKYYYSNSNVFYASGLAPYGSRIPSAKGNCTWYAWGRAYELTGTKPQPGLTGNAYTWWNGAAGKYSRGSTPKVGAIAVWKSNMPYSGGCGHVAIVEKIENGKVYISESGYPNTLFKYREIYSTNYLYGYIYIK